MTARAAGATSNDGGPPGALEGPAVDVGVTTRAALGLWPEKICHSAEPAAALIWLGGRPVAGLALAASVRALEREAGPGEVLERALLHLREARRQVARAALARAAAVREFDLSRGERCGTVEGGPVGIDVALGARARCSAEDARCRGRSGGNEVTCGAISAGVRALEREGGSRVLGDAETRRVETISLVATETAQRGERTAIELAAVRVGVTGGAGVG